MKYKIVIILSVISLIFLPWLQVKAWLYPLFLQVLVPGNLPYIEVKELQDKHHQVILLDARSWEEYSVSHLKKAVWVGYESFRINRVKDLPREATIVVYCSVGYRSDLLGETLKQAGFSNIYNLYGGIFAWVNQGLPVYAQGIPTQKIHPYSPVWGFWLLRGEKVMPS